MIRALSVELARHGVRANAILPGWIDTPMTERTPSRWDRSPRKSSRASRSAAGAPATTSAASPSISPAPRSAYHTGDTFLIDGGYSIF